MSYSRMARLIAASASFASSSQICENSRRPWLFSARAVFDQFQMNKVDSWRAAPRHRLGEMRNSDRGDQIGFVVVLCGGKPRFSKLRPLRSLSTHSPRLRRRVTKGNDKTRIAVLRHSGVNVERDKSPYLNHVPVCPRIGQAGGAEHA
jgi:hypothetical protein